MSKKNVEKIEPFSEAQLARLIAMRNSGIHISTVMLVHIVNHVKTQTGSAYVGEIHAYYEQISKTVAGNRGYSVQGMYTMLRKLVERGYLESAKDSRFNTYSPTLKGLMTVRGLF